VITLDDFFMGRDKDARFLPELSHEIVGNAVETVRRVNLLLARYFAARPRADRPRVTSGWRPKAINAATANAAPRSRHITGEAIDLSDPEGELDGWCLNNLDQLIECALWLEHPAATKSWCHLQIVPPRSGARVFFP